MLQPVPAATPTQEKTPASPTTGRQSWIVLALATVTAALTGPGQTLGVSVFIDHFVTDLDLTRSQVAGAYLVGTLTGATLLPSVGRFIDNRGVRRSQIIVGLLFGLALVNMSQVNGLIWLAVGFTGIRLLGQGSLSLIATVTVSLQFVKNRGTALGIFSTAASALMATVPVALSFAISQWGWRVAWLVAAGVVPTIVVAFAVFGLRDLPTGTATSGSSGIPAASSAEVSGTSVDRTQALRSRGFWILAAVSGSSGMLGTALNFHQIDLLGDAGLSSTAAAIMFLPQVLGSSVAGLSVGIIGDRIGTRYLPAAGMALLIAAHWMAAIVAPGIIVVLYAIVLGAMAGAVRTSTSTLLPTWFGTTHLGSIQGSLTFFTVGASAIGPVALAQLEGGFGSYRPAVLVLSVIPAIALVFSLADPKQSRLPVD